MATHINTNLLGTKGTLRVEAIEDKLTEVGLMVMGMHFLPRRKLWFK